MQPFTVQYGVKLLLQVAAAGHRCYASCLITCSWRKQVAGYPTPR